MGKQYKVFITKFAEKQLKKIPKHIKEHVRFWAMAVELQGIQEIRKLHGYHDEPLQRDRWGQRSIRLSLSYRLIYETQEDKENIIIKVIEVNKHEY